MRLQNFTSILCGLDAHQVSPMGTVKGFQYPLESLDHASTVLMPPDFSAPNHDRESLLGLTANDGQVLRWFADPCVNQQQAFPNQNVQVIRVYWPIRNECGVVPVMLSHRPNIARFEAL